jgi:hypothetical protein
MKVVCYVGFVSAVVSCALSGFDLAPANGTLWSGIAALLWVSLLAREYTK